MALQVFWDSNRYVRSLLFIVHCSSTKNYELITMNTAYGGASQFSQNTDKSNSSITLSFGWEMSQTAFQPVQGEDCKVNKVNFLVVV
jgi:hypothetical protein